MNDRRSHYERRKREGMPKVPFKDSNGATIKECRRKIPNRRKANIEAEQHSDGYFLVKF